MATLDSPTQIGLTVADVELDWCTPGSDPRIDGTWAPHSTDAPAALRQLIPLVSAHLGGRVTKVSLNIGAWG